MQGQRKEIIEDFKEIIKEHLRFFKQKNGFLPDKILYYRDGVSEGQFQEVMGTERQAMAKACTEIEQGYEKKVKITIIVVRYFIFNILPFFAYFIKTSFSLMHITGSKTSSYTIFPRQN